MEIMKEAVDLIAQNFNGCQSLVLVVCAVGVASVLMGKFVAASHDKNSFDVD